MATNKKSQLQKIENVLRKYSVSPGVTAKGIAHRARVPVENVYKRIYDLRESFTIYTNYHNVKGKRTAFYRIAE